LTKAQPNICSLAKKVSAYEEAEPHTYKAFNNNLMNRDQQLVNEFSNVPQSTVQFAALQSSVQDQFNVKSTRCEICTSNCETPWIEWTDCTQSSMVSGNQARGKMTSLAVLSAAQDMPPLHNEEAGPDYSVPTTTRRTRMPQNPELREIRR
jgi:hypothetical protein